MAGCTSTVLVGFIMNAFPGIQLGKILAGFALFGFSASSFAWLKAGDSM
jgi:hypothetical protein